MYKDLQEVIELLHAARMIWVHYDGPILDEIEWHSSEEDRYSFFHLAHTHPKINAEDEDCVCRHNVGYLIARGYEKASEPYDTGESNCPGIVHWKILGRNKYNHREMVFSARVINDYGAIIDFAKKMINRATPLFRRTPEIRDYYAYLGELLDTFGCNPELGLCCPKVNEWVRWTDRHHSSYQAGRFTWREGWEKNYLPGEILPAEWVPPYIDLPYQRAPTKNPVAYIAHKRYRIQEYLELFDCLKIDTHRYNWWDVEVA